MKIDDVNKAAEIWEQIQDCAQMTRNLERYEVFLAIRERDARYTSGEFDDEFRRLSLCEATKEQRAALEEQLRGVATEWLERHRAGLLDRLRALGVEVDRDAAE